METATLVRELVEARGASGYEAEVREVVRKRFSEFAHEVRVDAMGNLIALRRGEGASGERPCVMLAGHMDEIALMVTRIEKGFLQVTQVGGFDPRVLFGQEVVVHGSRELPALVVSIPPHFTDPSEREKPVPLDKLYVDVGLPQDDVEAAVHVGDVMTLQGRFIPLVGGYVAGKSMDNRAAVAAIVLCLEELARRRHSWNVFAVATVQEEASMAGAVTGAYGIDPTIAVAVDVTFGMQPGLSPGETVKMDGGPSIAIGPNFHPVVRERLTAAASALEIPHQTEVIAGPSGTDAWAIQVSRSGVPCGLIGIPVRSMHTPVETVCLRDIERSAKLLAEFIARLTPGFEDSLSLRDALSAGNGRSAKQKGV
jgi:endoglucanase